MSCHTDNCPDCAGTDCAGTDCGSQDDTDIALYGGGDWVFDNAEMHAQFGVNEAVDKLDRQKLLTFLKFRLDFLQEELNEARLAYDTIVDLQPSITFDPAAIVAGMQLDDLPQSFIAQTGNKAAEDVVDAMIDLCVVAIGTLDLFQVDAYEAWDRVHVANMSKEVGIKPGRPNPLSLPDLVKPPGWQGPTHADNIGILNRLYE